MTAWHIFLISYPHPASSVRQVVDGVTERWFFMVAAAVIGLLLAPLIVRPALRLRPLATIWTVLTSLLGR